MSLSRSNIVVPTRELGVGYTRNGNCFTILGAVTAPAITTTSANSDTTNFSPFYVPVDGQYYVSYNITSVSASGAIQESIFKYDPSMVLGETIVNQSYASAASGERQIECTLPRGIYFISLRSNPGVNLQIASLSTAAIGNAQQVDFGFYINQVKLNGLSLPNIGIFRGLRVYDNSTNPALVHTYNGTISDFDQYRTANKYLYYDAAANVSPKICLARTA